jgi:molybdopterin/thiamine biosynthesis adenylyltransferase
VIELQLDGVTSAVAPFRGTLSPADIERLAGSRVTLVGLGNIGSHAALQLARMNIGVLQLIDRDFVEERNLANQAYSDPQQVGRSKAELIAEQVLCIAPGTVVKPLVADVEDVPVGRFATSHLILGALDSLHARQVLGNERAYCLNLPYIDGGVDAAGEWLGRVQVLIPGAACLECGWSDQHYRETARETPCDPDGQVSGRPTLAPALLGAVVAGVMVAETIKLLLGHASVTSREIAFDLASGRWMTSQLRRANRCRFHHQVASETLFLSIPFGAAKVSDLLAVLNRRFGDDPVQLEFRRRVFDSGVYGASRFIPPSYLEPLEHHRLAQLRLSPDDFIRVVHDGESVLIALR